MIIKFNNIEIEDIKVLEQKELKAWANFNIELIETNNEWIQFFCEDDTVSIAMKKIIQYHIIIISIKKK